MAQPGETTRRLVKVLDALGNGVTGLTLASFTFSSYGFGYGASVWSSYAAGAVLTAIGGGLYSLSFALPASAGWWRCMLEHASLRVWSGSWEGELETQDWDSLYGSIVQPVATLSTSAQLGSVLPITMVVNRWRRLDIPITDSAGNPYTNLATDFPSSTLRVSVRSKDQTTTKWDAGPSGVISAGAGTAANFLATTTGAILSLEIPEDSGFFAALPAATDSLDVYIEVVGDLGGVAAKTQPILRSSPLTLSRREVGT